MEPTKPPLGLKEFDLVLFRPGGGFVDQAIGKGISWAEQAMGCKSPEFVHVAVAMMKDGQLMLFQTNPPKPAYRALDSVDWDNVAVMSFTGGATDQVRLGARTWADAKLPEGVDPYGFPSIAGFLALGLLGKVWPQADRAILARRNVVASKSMEVCSQIVDDMFMDKLGLDILPEVGEGQAVPADMTGSEWHSHSFGRLGA